MNPTPTDHSYAHSDATHRAWPAGALSRPRWQPGEEVEGWVTAEVTPVSTAAGITRRAVRSTVCAGDRRVSEWACQPVGKPALACRRRRAALRSRLAVVVDGDCAPQVTPELQQLVDDLARQAQSSGWEPAGRGRTWCSLRFRKPYAQMRGQLQWR